MKTCQALSWSAAAALAVSLAGAAHADPLVLTNVPAARAAAQIGARYGVEVRLQKYSWRHVTLALDDADGAGARLEAVNALANAVGMDFTKTYVIQKNGGGPTVSAQVDSSATLPVKQRTLPVREAIAMVAGVDDAVASVADDVSGTVTLSGSPLTVARAAEEIAQQTGTRWRTEYVLTPRAQGPDLGGTVVGRTGGGAAIIQLAFVYYEDPVKEAQRQREAEASQRQAALEQTAAQQQALAQQTAAGQQAAALRTALIGAASNGTPNGGGYFPNGYNPYNSYGNYGNPYAGSAYGSARAYSPTAGLTIVNQGYTPVSSSFSVGGY